MNQTLNTAHALPIAGIRLGAVAAGVRKVGRQDLCAIEICEGAVVAGIFTQNVFCAAPVLLAREHLASAPTRLLIINSGNANAGTGAQGLDDAREVCVAAGKLWGVPARAVLPFSTGVIGQRLPIARIIDALPNALALLTADGWSAAANAIMTTDTVPKCVSAQATVGEHTFTVTGIAKGAGMIKPNMATLLSFIATDAPLTADAVTKLLQTSAAQSFNRITIDGDTSTNDSCVLIATGRIAPTERIDSMHPAWGQIAAAVETVFLELARALVRDGEGATKLVTVRVRGGSSTAACLQVAYAVAESPLVKTALFASDPNWGRILAAVGRSGVAELCIEEIGISLNDYPIIVRGEPVPSYSEKIAAEIMARREFDIGIEIGSGAATVEVMTCDFSYDYVKINAEYRS